VAERRLAQQVKHLSSTDKTQLRLTMQFCTKRRSDCLGEAETMLDLIRKLIGTKAPDAEDDGGFKNTFGKSYGTDHLLKMGWLSYFASTFPPGSKWVPKAGKLED
jgi:hypothetical protein